MHFSCIHQAPSPISANSAFVHLMVPTSLPPLFMHFQQICSKQPRTVLSGILRPQYTPPFFTTTLLHLEHETPSARKPIRVSSFSGSGALGSSGLATPCSLSHTFIFSEASSGGGAATSALGPCFLLAALPAGGLRLLEVLLRSVLSCGCEAPFPGSSREGCRARSGCLAGGFAALGTEGAAAGAEKARPRLSAACCRSTWLGVLRNTSGMFSSSDDSSSAASAGSSLAETSHLPLSATSTSVTSASEASSTDCAKASSSSTWSGSGLSHTGQHQACLGGMFRMVCT
mmetsp:Transcript_114475/g.306951  ORF Transcript_114475/g.306951 Transcript_114475/m.306951 type:complete len:287 (+) Transcript_114475:260-1120(+)